MLFEDEQEAFHYGYRYAEDLWFSWQLRALPSEAVYCATVDERLPKDDASLAVYVAEGVRAFLHTLR